LEGSDTKNFLISIPARFKIGKPAKGADQTFTSDRRETLSLNMTSTGTDKQLAGLVKKTLSVNTAEQLPTGSVHSHLFSKQVLKGVIKYLYTGTWVKGTAIARVQISGKEPVHAEMLSILRSIYFNPAIQTRSQASLLIRQDVL